MPKEKCPFCKVPNETSAWICSSCHKPLAPGWHLKPIDDLSRELTFLAVVMVALSVILAVLYLLG